MSVRSNIYSHEHDMNFIISSVLNKCSRNFRMNTLIWENYFSSFFVSQGTSSAHPHSATWTLIVWISMLFHFFLIYFAIYLLPRTLKIHLGDTHSLSYLKHFVFTHRVLWDKIRVLLKHFVMSFKSSSFKQNISFSSIHKIIKGDFRKV